MKKVKATIQKIGCHYLLHNHGNLKIWESMYYATSLAVPETWEFHREADYYIRELSEGDDKDPCYRVIVALSHEGTTELEAYLKSKLKKVFATNA